MTKPEAALRAVLLFHSGEFDREQWNMLSRQCLGPPPIDNDRAALGNEWENTTGNLCAIVKEALKEFPPA